MRKTLLTSTFGVRELSQLHMHFSLAERASVWGNEADIRGGLWACFLC